MQISNISKLKATYCHIRQYKNIVKRLFLTYLLSRSVARDFRCISIFYTERLVAKLGMVGKCAPEAGCLGFLQFRFAYVYMLRKRKSIELTLKNINVPNINSSKCNFISHSFG